ncbi:MAG: DUF4058 family protein [Gemmataceae bacterium]
MPLHDWTRVAAGDFHHFHQYWVPLLALRLNQQLLPDDYFAMVDQHTGGPVPDVVTLTTSPPPPPPNGFGHGNGYGNGTGTTESSSSGGTATATATRTASATAQATRPSPSAQFIERMEYDHYVQRANRIVIRHRHGRVVAIIEILSPGNKHSAAAFQQFLRKSVAVLEQRVNFLIVDCFPPGTHDPLGIHPAIWQEIGGAKALEETVWNDGLEPPPRFRLDPPKDRLIASYTIEFDVPVAYLEPVAIGEALPSIPLFLTENLYVDTPLEATYQESWAAVPRIIQNRFHPPADANPTSAS